jgi:hypothetical protein
LAASPSEISNVYREGIVAGVLGAATIAVWFFVLDIFSGRPFYTPTVLGTALFRHGIGLDQPQMLPISLEMVLFYTWVHGLAFCVVGGLAAKLLALAEENLNVGFGILLFFVIFEFGFVATASIFAEPILEALAWPTVLVGNLLAAVAMATYFWRRHPHMVIKP